MGGGHEHPLTAALLLQQLRPTPGTRWLVATGQYSPAPAAATRVIVFADPGSRLRIRLDAWLAPSELPLLVTALAKHGEARVVKSDAMYATPPEHVWSREGDALRLWRRQRLIARIEADRVSLRSRWWRSWQHAAVADFSAVHAFLAPDWARRGVRLVRRADGAIAIADAVEVAALLDPTYDGIDLLCDAAWVTDLARDIAEVTGLPTEIDADLR